MWKYKQKLKKKAKKRKQKMKQKTEKKKALASRSPGLAHLFPLRETNSELHIPVQIATIDLSQKMSPA